MAVDAVALQLPTDGAGRKVDAEGDVRERIVGIAQRMDALSLVLVQVATGHGQRHVAVKQLLYNSGCCT